MSLLRLRKLVCNQVGYQQANILWLNGSWITRYTQLDLIIVILQIKGFSHKWGAVYHSRELLQAFKILLL